MLFRLSTQKAVEIFLSAKLAKGVSPTTLESYRYRLGVFARTHRQLPKKPAHVQAFITSMGPSQETRNTYYRLLRNLYRLLNTKGVCNFNPMPKVDAPFVPQKIARALTARQLGQLLLHPDHSPEERALLYLLADTGLRISEALTVNAPDRLLEDTAIATGKGRRDREIPVSAQVLQMVRDVIPWPWTTRRSAYDAVHRSFARAGLLGPRSSPHTLRHTFTRLWEGDESLLEGILGWTSSRMLKVYRPYNLRRAREQHKIHTPIAIATDHATLQGRLL